MGDVKDETKAERGCECLWIPEQHYFHLFGQILLSPEMSPNRFFACFQWILPMSGIFSIFGSISELALMDDKRFGANDMFRTWFDGNKVLDGICRFYVVLDERIHFEKFCCHSEACSIVLLFLGMMICGIDIFSVSFATFLLQVR